jgi:DNA-nicking Smr family endonuclease
MAKKSCVMKRVRALTPHERALWSFVARSVKPVKRGAIKADMSMEELLDAPEKVDKSQPIEVKSIDLVQPEKNGQKIIRPQMPPLAPIERNLRRKLNRGKVNIDAKLDLHGMRQDEAYNTLISFVTRAAQHEKQLVLIVTGKGERKLTYNNEFSETGVLRRMVPIWLSDPNLRNSVIGFEEAAIGHGGSGALYVRLRRSK